MESVKNINMSQEQFYDFMKESIQGFFPNCEVIAGTVDKSMGEKVCLTVREPNSNVAPTVYLDTAWNNFLNSGKDGSRLMSIAGDLAKTVESAMNRIFFSGEEISKMIRENWRSIVTISLVPYKDNEAFLQKGIYDKFLDMAKTYYLNVVQDGDGGGRIRVNESVLSMIGVSEEELKACAMENTKNQEFCCKDILDTLAEFQDIPEDTLAEMKAMCSVSERMYVLTNKTKQDGATAILFDDIIKDFLEEKEFKGVFVLPSSRHEVLLVPMESGRSVDELKEMVRQVNDTEVSPEDLLSYSVYFFDKEKGLMQCKNGFYVDAKGGHNKADDKILD